MQVMCLVHRQDGNADESRIFTSLRELVARLAVWSVQAFVSGRFCPSGGILVLYHV